MDRVRIKICCISSHEEARMAVAAGADALGFVSDMPSGPGILDDDRIRSLIREVPPPISTFLLTRRLDVDGIVEQASDCAAHTVQVCDHVQPAVLAQVRERCPWLRVVQVVHVVGAESVEVAARYHDVAHALLLDSGRPGADFQELGGTGRTHDWSVSRAIVQNSPVPVWLAGGLRPSNVAQAIAEVGPFGVDLCSGVRTDGHLDEAKLRAFVAAVYGTNAP